MTTDAYIKMAQNNAWANDTLYQAAMGLPQGAALLPAPGFFPTLLATLNHIYEVDLFYVDALEAGGRGGGGYARGAGLDLAGLCAPHAAVDARPAPESLEVGKRGGLWGGRVN